MNKSVQWGKSLKEYTIGRDELMSSENKGGAFLAGVVIGSLFGAAVGATVALLFAPQPGEETRAQIRQKGIELKERAAELTEEARKKAEELQEEGRVTIETQKSRIGEAIEEGKKAAAKKKKELLEQFEKESGKTEKTEA
jgi:gas vesicle protein